MGFRVSETWIKIWNQHPTSSHGHSELMFQGKVNSNSQLNPSLITLWESHEKAFLGSVPSCCMWQALPLPLLCFPRFGISGEVKNQSLNKNLHRDFWFIYSLLRLHTKDFQLSELQSGSIVLRQMTIFCMRLFVLKRDGHFPPLYTTLFLGAPC